MENNDQSKKYTLEELCAFLKARFGEELYIKQISCALDGSSENFLFMRKDGPTVASWKGRLVASPKPGEPRGPSEYYDLRIIDTAASPAETPAEPIELHNMQLAAIMTATFQNTRSTIKDRIGCDNPYWTVAYGDVCRAVDREMKERDAKNAAYNERNRLVAALARCFPSGLAKTAIEGWSEDWHNCVYIDLPTGQASWHFHDSEAHLFAGLPPYLGKWDGHTTEEKYERLSKLIAGQASIKPCRS